MCGQRLSPFLAVACFFSRCCRSQHQLLSHTHPLSLVMFSPTAGHSPHFPQHCSSTTKFGLFSTFFFCSYPFLVTPTHDFHLRSPLSLFNSSAFFHLPFFFTSSPFLNPVSSPLRQLQFDCRELSFAIFSGRYRSCWKLAERIQYCWVWWWQINLDRPHLYLDRLATTVRSIRCSHTTSSRLIFEFCPEQGDKQTAILPVHSKQISKKTQVVISLLYFREPFIPSGLEEYISRLSSGEFAQVFFFPFHVRRRPSLSSNLPSPLQLSKVVSWEFRSHCHLIQLSEKRFQYLRIWMFSVILSTSSSICVTS